jgi:glutathionyl-hydroquinone reductase
MSIPVPWAAPSIVQRIVQLPQHGAAELSRLCVKVSSAQKEQEKMGLLIEGKWHDQWYDTKSTNGAFVRKDAQFRNWVTADAAPGPSGEGGFKAEPGRYHLYLSLACPWAHRTLIFRTLKKLEPLIGVSVVHPLMLDKGWTFDTDFDGATGDMLMGKSFMHEIYTAAAPAYSGRVTVPVLWDKQRKTIVSNESSEIIRMFNASFDQCGAAPGNYYPEAMRGEIDALNTVIYETVNNGVYRCGFATSQHAYEDAFAKLFGTLGMLERRLENQSYLVGGQLTEADWRLFTTLIRFDAVYVGHFKCNKRRIADYANLSAYLRNLYAVPGVAETVNMAQIKHHYYASHASINPTGIVSAGPELDFG